MSESLVQNIVSSMFCKQHSFVLCWGPLVRSVENNLPLVTSGYQTRTPQGQFGTISISCINLFRAYSEYIRHETFSFMMSFPAMSLGLRFCMSRKGRTGGGGWVHLKGANSMAASGLVLRSDLVGTLRAISILFGINSVRNKRSHLVGPPFPVFKTHFSATAGWHFSRHLTRRLLIGGCGQSHVSAKRAVLSLTTREYRN